MKASIVISATAKVQLPELAVNNLHARVDTGAATCALHASSITIDEERNELRGYSLILKVIYTQVKN